MNYRYFVPTPTTQAEAKTMFRQLAHQHHPDKGGDLEAMKQVNAEYAHLITELEKSNQRQRQAEAHKEGRKTAADYHDLNEVAEVLREKIEIALNLKAASVELIGLWVWVTFEGKPAPEIRETLKATGFKWAHKKRAWSYAGVPSFGRKNSTLEEIRQSYGSTRFTRREREDSELLPA